MQNKPSSKIIQIQNTGTCQDQFIGIVLCEDQSIWERYFYQNTSKIIWHCILEAPTQLKSDLPEVGSRWRDKECHSLELTVVEGVRFELISSKLRNSMSAQDFLNIYEPIPTQSDNKE